MGEKVYMRSFQRCNLDSPHRFQHCKIEVETYAHFNHLYIDMERLGRVFIT